LKSGNVNSPGLKDMKRNMIAETYLEKKKTHWLNTIIADIIIIKIQGEGKTKQK
jgi:hypothetical protein